MSDTQAPDDLQAVRAVIDAVKPFPPEDQQRIFRWAAEKLKLRSEPSPGGETPEQTKEGGTGGAARERALDIRSFVHAKSPKSDVQFAAAVAYYLKFEAPAAERKDFLSEKDLREAFRKAKRHQPRNVYQTLHNAKNLGYLDAGAEKGTFAINSVGENLVAIVLPGGEAESAQNGRRKPNRRSKKARA